MLPEAALVQAVRQSTRTHPQPLEVVEVQEWDRQKS
jgi:hypothetical protein